MKWIGQHIWDLISRFRSDVYLDNIEDGTVANDKFLGLDANNKIVKEAASTTVTDLHSAGVDGSANQMLTDNGDGTVTSESTCLFSTDVGQQFWVSGTAPYINVSNNTNDDQPGRLQFFNTRSGNNGVDGDSIGQMNFIGSDSGGNITSFARIESSIVTALHTDEAGKLELKSATSDGGSPSGSTLQQALTATGHGTNNTIDIGLGYGTASTTTIAGDLDIDGDNMTSAGAMTFTPVGLYTIVAPDISGPAFVIDADADTDNEVEINAGILDINANSATIDVATSLNVTGSVKMLNRTLTVTAGSAAGEFDGDVVYTGTTTSMTTGALYVYANTGSWVLANASAEGTTKGLLAIALGAASDVNGMLLRGMVTTAAVAGTPDEGAELYVRASDGTVTTVAPGSSGQFVRIVGYCIENSNNRIYFNPDNTYIEIA